MGCVRVPLLLLVVDDLARLQIVLLVFVHLALSVQHVVASLGRIHRLIRPTLQVRLPDQHLVSILDLDLLILEWERDTTLAVLVMLQELALLRPIEVVIDVVAKSLFHPVHFADRGVVLLP